MSPVSPILRPEGTDLVTPNFDTHNSWIIGEWVSDTFSDPHTNSYYHRTLNITEDGIEIKCYQNDKIWEHTVSESWNVTDSSICLWDRKEKISGHYISSRVIKYRNKLELWEYPIARDTAQWVKYNKTVIR